MNKIPVAILGATGIVGQRFVQMLADHPWFEIAAVVGSSRSAGRKYGDAANWVIAGDPPENVIDMTVLGLEDDIPGRIAFSALPTSVAREFEPGFAEKGFAVCSNASAFRQAPGVPVIIPEVNGDHIAMLEHQRKVQSWKGLIVTSPNCTTTGMVMAMKPLDEAYQVDKVFVTSFQAISGAGYPGVSFLDINDNLIPYIGGEEEKMESESLLLLGQVDNGKRIPAGHCRLSASQPRSGAAWTHRLPLDELQEQAFRRRSHRNPEKLPRAGSGLEPAIRAGASGGRHHAARPPAAAP